MNIFKKVKEKLKVRSFRKNLKKVNDYFFKIKMCENATFKQKEMYYHKYHQLAEFKFLLFDVILNDTVLKNYIMDKEEDLILYCDKNNIKIEEILFLREIKLYIYKEIKLEYEKDNK